MAHQPAAITEKLFLISKSCNADKISNGGAITQQGHANEPGCTQSSDVPCPSAISAQSEAERYRDTWLFGALEMIVHRFPVFLVLLISFCGEISTAGKRGPQITHRHKAQCPGGWFFYNAHCYGFFRYRLRWQDAENSTWEWTDGADFRYSAWFLGGPNRAEEKTCVVLLAITGDKFWSNLPARGICKYLCKFEL